MRPDMTTELLYQALVTTAMVAAPFLVVGIAVGIAVALLQAATQVHEAALSFVPKVVATALVFTLAGPWLLERLATFGVGAFTKIAEVGRNAGR